LPEDKVLKYTENSPKPITNATLFQRHIQSEGETHARMRRSFLGFWEERLKIKTLADLKGILPRVEKTLRELKGKGRSGKTLRNYADGLAAFCDWCKKRDYLDHDPLEKLQPFDATPQTKRRALTPDEIRQLLAACQPNRKLTYEMALCTGLRAGELQALRVSHLDPSKGGVHLEAAWTKNRKGGFQPLPK
jgi:integrase